MEINVSFYATLDDLYLYDRKINITSNYGRMLFLLHCYIMTGTIMLYFTLKIILYITIDDIFL